MSRFLRAIRGETVDCVPIWLMRQAGRYLPEYREIRAQAGDFLTLCHTPSLACEVTLQPLRRFALDAAIIFSDILIVPDAMGMGLYFVTGEGPQLHRRIRDSHDVQALPTIDAARDMRFVCEAISMTKRELAGKTPLIGFAGSPWTLATYMIEGGKAKDDFKASKSLLYDHPAVAQALLDKLTVAVTDLLLAQIQAGADAVMLFDTWGGILSHDAHLRYSVSSIAQVVTTIREQASHVPVIVYGKGAMNRAALVATGCHVLGIDWTVDAAEALRSVGDSVCIQGNMDPLLLTMSETTVIDEAKRILDAVRSVRDAKRFIFNLGHGVRPDVSPERVATLVDTVHDYSRR